MRGIHRWLAMYDITDPKRLRAVAKIMESFGIRVQKSVFEISCNDKVIDRLHQRVMEVAVDPDSIVFIPLCMDDLEKIERYGKGGAVDKDIIDCDTLFL